MAKFLLLIGLCLLSCTSDKQFERRDPRNLYIGTSHTKYFLPDIPAWSNFSSIGHCRISSSIKYLNFENLYRSYGLSYEELVQFQYLFNRTLTESKAERGEQELLLQDEAFIFFNTQEKILGGAKAFLKPSFPNINVFWIDPALRNRKILKRLVKVIKSEKGDQGYPVFLSRCLDLEGIEQFVVNNKLQSYGIRYLPTYMFSPYNRFMKLGHFFQLNLGEIFKGKKVNFLAPLYPDFIFGKVNFVKI